jgi:hypothetical protein
VGSSPDAIGAVRAIRADTTYAMTPVTIVGASQAIRDLAERDELTLNIADPGELSQTLDEARQLLAGRAMTPEAASEWAVRAAEAIHRLGVTGNRVYDISRAEAALIENLDDEREPVRLAASAALAVMRSAQAQRAVAELANEPATPETVRIASYKDLASSLRLYGNQLTEQQSQATVEVVGGNGSTDLLTAAAGALGAMNLPTDQVKVLILDTGDAVVPQPAGS